MTARSDPATGFLTPTPIWQGACRAGFGRPAGPPDVSPGPVRAAPAHESGGLSGTGRGAAGGVQGWPPSEASSFRFSVPRSVLSMKALARGSCVA